MTNETILYILKFSIFLSLVYLFYRLLLRRLTFYNWNRYYLLGYSVLAFFIPFINISPLLKQTDLNRAPAIQYIPVMDPYVHSWTSVKSQTISLVSHFFSWQDFAFWTLLAGSLSMLLRLCIQLLSFLHMKRKATKLNEDAVSIYHVESPIIPFSFGNSIYVNPKLHTEKELGDIILHEYAHVQQKHTIDILLAETVCIVNWFNPLAWLLRHAIRQNLEFIADDLVLQKGMDKKIYQYHLLKVTGVPQYRIFNSFNFSSLKKRIFMMNKIKSAKIHVMKFGFLIPLLVVVLLAFRNKTESLHTKQSSLYHLAGLAVDIRTEQRVADVSITEMQSGVTATTDVNGFYKLDIPVQQNNQALHFQARKKGYSLQEYNFSIPANALGYIYVTPLFESTGSEQKGKPNVFIGASEPFNGNPEYADVLKVYQRVSMLNKQANEYLGFISDHPDVSLFYISEAGKHIVFLKNGSYERYGYPGAPTMEDMEKKYGPLPDMMKSMQHAPGPEYLSHWEKIAEEAEKEFHTSNPDALHIIFPGDSRVIAVSKSGKPRIYDMDNAALEERPAFEKLYGPLPALVPPPTNNTSKNKMIAPASMSNSEKNSSVIDTLIRPNALAGTNSVLKPDSSVSVSSSYDFKKILVILDGKEMPHGVSLNGIVDPNLIDTITILKDSSATRKYGEKAKDGVIIIKTKNYQQLKLNKPPASDHSLNKKNLSTDSIPHFTGQYVDNASVQDGILHWKLEKDYPKHPLYLVDGQAIGTDPNKIHIDPDEQSSMEFATKGEILKKYGSDAKDGVVNIVTKKNKDNPSAHIFGKNIEHSPDYVQAMFVEAAIRNKMYTGLENPIKIDAPGIDDEKILVQTDNGSVEKRDGLYYIKPVLPGNTEIRIYEKQTNGHLKLLNSRYFRVENLSIE